MSTNQKPSKKKRKGRIRWSRVGLLLLPILAVAIGVWALVQAAHPLKLKAETYIVELKGVFDPKGNIDSVFLGSKDDVLFNGSVNTEEPNSTTASYTYKGKEYPFKVEVRDTKGPELEVKDITTDTIETVTAESFIESLSDASQVSTRMDGDDSSGRPGTYTITITAKDEYDNTTVKKAKLKRKQDTTAPKLDGFEDQVTMKQGGYYSQSTYPISDDLDTNPTLSVDQSQLDTTIPGTYKVNYITRDRSGNSKIYEQTVTVTENPDYGKQICYLTFDDGPSGVTDEILQILKDNDVQATFFVTGANPEHYEKMKKIVEDGHTIALHTYSHDYANVYASEDSYFDDLKKISDLVEKETGVKADVIRFPGGSSNMVSADYQPGIMTKLVDEVHQKGYEYFDWNVDSTDASGNGVAPEILIENASNGIGLDDAVILMHDTDAKQTTAQALNQIIQNYKNAGYVFRGLTKESMPVHHNVNN